MNDVLVLDSETQSGLAVVRSLGSNGVTVTAASHEDPSLGMVSKHSTARFVHPEPEEHGGMFIESLVDHLESNQYDAVVPVSDQTTTLAVGNRETLEATGATIATEEPETYSKAYDKAKTFAIAAELDVPIPETVAPDSVSDLADRYHDLEFPVVVKSRSKSVRRLAAPLQGAPERLRVQPC